MNALTLALCRIALAALLLLGAMPVRAIPILVFSTYNETTQELRTLISANGLTPTSGATIGAFDFNFHYDPTLLRLEQVNFRSLLGSPDKSAFRSDGDKLVVSMSGSGQALSYASLTTGVSNALRLASASLLEAGAGTCTFCTGPYLNELQGSVVPLVSLTFHSLVVLPNIHPQTLGYEMARFTVSDGQGNPYLYTPVQFSPVPLPPTLALFGIGLFGLLRWRPARA